MCTIVRCNLHNLSVDAKRKQQHNRGQQSKKKIYAYNRRPQSYKGHISNRVLQSNKRQIYNTRRLQQSYKEQKQISNRLQQSNKGHISNRLQQSNKEHTYI